MPQAALSSFHADLRRTAPIWAYGLEDAPTQAGFLQFFTARAAAPDADPGHALSRASLALWGWQSRPMHPEYGPPFATAVRETAGKDAPVSRLAAACAALPASPVPGGIGPALLAGDAALLVRSLLPLMREPLTGAAALALAWDTLLRLGSPDLARACASACVLPPEAEPLRARLLAEVAFHYEAPDAALGVLNALDQAWGLWAAQRRAECLAALGESREAARLYAGLWKAMPWHVNLALRLHDLLHPVQPDPALAERIEAVICLYSWNKRELLADTLDSLAASQLGRAVVAVLDNGSSDGTCEMLEARAGEFARFTPVRLPVNVGAPSARNWLLTLPEVKAASWAVFLDDDVVLPQDWLARLLTTGEAEKARGGRVGAVGCRITEARQPFGLQSADYHLFFPQPLSEEADAPRIGVFDNCSGQLDTGLFTYARSCLSVSGCCHAISREALDTVGAFDVRFTPTQFDDLDRDMRSCLAELPSVYEGRLAVRHVQHSSLARAQTPAQVGHIRGNRVKLEGKYGEEELTRLARADAEGCWRHLEGILPELGAS